MTRLIAFGGTDTFFERNGEFINLPESSDCPLFQKRFYFVYSFIIIIQKLLNQIILMYT